jgi:hypothetical protein
MSTENVAAPGLSGIQVADAGAAQVHVDPVLTLALAQASLAAYADFDGGMPVIWPADYQLVDRWTGWDASIFGGREERFGLVFKSMAQPKTFIFAFRGTDSDLDAWEDAWFITTRFHPHQNTVSPTPYVSSGFYGIYDSKGGSMKQSMRQQLFSLIDKYQPLTIYVTGHSLGGALSQLFTLDLAVSAPQIWAKNMNFASPMVGTHDWKKAYEGQAAQKDPARQTVRIYNTYDWAPSVPPSLFNYTHVGVPFRTTFHVKGEPWWNPHLIARHSIMNLETMLNHAVWRSPQVWAGTFTDATDPPRLMESHVPTGADVAWVDQLAGIRDLEASLRPASPPEPAVAEG